MKRLLLASLLGGTVMFFWGAVSHLVLFKGDGFSDIPDEDRVVVDLKQHIPRDGLYYFPGLEQEQQAAKMRQGPSGMIVFHPGGSEPISARKLLVQFWSELLGALIIALVLARSRASYGMRVIFGGLLGMFACLSVSTIYWNWYGFPDGFFLAQCADKILGWTLAGAAMAGVLRRQGFERGGNALTAAV